MIANKLAFLAGGGEMGERIRAFDWASTPLGSAEGWSPALKTLLQIMLANRFPMILWWGQQYIQFYNDAYRPVPGQASPPGSGHVPAVNAGPKSGTSSARSLTAPSPAGRRRGTDDIFLEINRHGFVEGIALHDRLQPGAGRDGPQRHRWRAGDGSRDHRQSRGRPARGGAARPRCALFRSKNCGRSLCHCRQNPGRPPQGHPVCAALSN